MHNLCLEGFNGERTHQYHHQENGHPRQNCRMCRWSRCPRSGLGRGQDTAEESERWRKEYSSLYHWFCPIVQQHLEAFQHRLSVTSLLHGLVEILPPRDSGMRSSQRSKNYTPNNPSDPCCTLCLSLDWEYQYPFSSILSKLYQNSDDKKDRRESRFQIDSWWLKSSWSSSSRRIKNVAESHTYFEDQ